MIKHIFSDMDGTLLQSDCTLSENNIKVIKESQIPFTLVSARSPMEMTEAIAQLGLTEPQIGFNGGLIFQKNASGLKILHQAPIELKGVQEILEMMQQEFPDVSCSLYDLDHWYVEKMDRGVKHEAKLGGQTPEIANFVSLLKQPTIKIFKVMMISFDETEMKRLSERLSQLNPELFNAKQSGTEYLEVTSNLAHKSHGIKYIQESEQLKKSEMAAFGDGYNDLSMLEMVGTPIVMDNALDGVKEYGRYITLDNDNDGVAHGIQKYLV